MDLNRTPQGTLGSNPTHLHASSTPAKFCSSETHFHYLENHPAKGISIASAHYSGYKTSRQIRGNVLSQSQTLIEVTCIHTPRTTRWRRNERRAKYSAILFTEETDLLLHSEVIA